MRTQRNNPKAHFIKNTDIFLFKVSSGSGPFCSKRPTLENDAAKIRIYLNGVVHNHNGPELLAGFTRCGCDFIRSVEGSFILFVELEDGFYVLTDKLNSKKAYCMPAGEDWLVSNDIDLLPVDACSINPTGVACYLANGVMLNDITLFEQIRCARRASIHHIREGQLTLTRYWDLDFRCDRATYDENRADDELAHLLVESVRTCYQAADRPWLSLSAGSDSRTILGILQRYLQASDVTCFSYTLTNPPRPGSDAALAAVTARDSGYPHRIVASYAGDLLEAVKENAREGKCLASFCDEIHAWHTLANDSRITDLICGDQFVRTFDIPSPHKADILDSLSLRGEISMRWLKAFLPQQVYRVLKRCLNDLIEEIYAGVDRFSDPEDKKYYLAIDQRLNHRFLPWREHFSSQAGYVHNPLLDARLFDFLMKSPPEVRLKKNLFSRSVQKMLPEMFASGFASHGGYSFDLAREIKNHRDELIAFVQGTRSRLDEMIPQKIVIDLLRKVNRRAEFQWQLSRRVDYLRKRSKPVDALLKPFLGTRGRLDPPGTILIRLLLIRTYLSTPV